MKKNSKESKKETKTEGKKISKQLKVPQDARPMPFIQSQDGKFVVMPEAAKMLSQVRGKVSVICVAGPYRTGKSFLLNRLIGQQSGFQVGGTVKACTKGTIIIPTTKIIAVILMTLIIIVTQLH